MITWNQHKIQVLQSIFASLKEEGKTNPLLYVTTKDYKNVILPIPSDLLSIDSLRDKTDESLRYITKTAKALHVTFVSEVNKCKIDQATLTEEEEEMIQNQSINRELKDKIDKCRVDGLILNTFSKEKGSVEKEFMIFEKVDGTYIPDKEGTSAMNNGDIRNAHENRFVDILE